MFFGHNREGMVTMAKKVFVEKHFGMLIDTRVLHALFLHFAICTILSYYWNLQGVAILLETLFYKFYIYSILTKSLLSIRAFAVFGDMT